MKYNPYIGNGLIVLGAFIGAVQLFPLWQVMCGLAVIAVMGFWVINDRDVYYGYGRAVALIYNGHTAEYDGVSLTFKRDDGRSAETYMCSLGKSVYKLLKRNGVRVTVVERNE